MKKRAAVYSSSRRLPPAPAVETHAAPPPRQPIAWKKFRVPAAAALTLLVVLSLWLFWPAEQVAVALPQEAAQRAGHAQVLIA